jgi:hypothetical protein
MQIRGRCLRWPRSTRLTCQRDTLARSARSPGAIGADPIAQCPTDANVVHASQDGGTLAAATRTGLQARRATPA